MEGIEKEVLGLKEMMLEQKKAVDRMAGDIRENSSYRRRDKSGTSDGSVMKLKGRMDNSKTSTETGAGTIDRSKYKKLEMLLYVG